MNNRTICQQIIEELRNLISSETFLFRFRMEKHFVRKRRLSMQQTIFFLFHASKRCMNLDIASIQDELPTVAFPDVSKQAVSKARKGINPELFRTLFRNAVELFYSQKKSTKTWHGYRLFAIDGTRIQVPKNPINIEHFGHAKNNKARIITAMASASIMYDLNHDMIIDAVLENFNYAERKAAQRHLDYFEQQDMKENAIVLFDRGYPSYEFFKRITKEGYYYLMRVQEKVYSLTRQDSADTITDYVPGYLKDEESIKVRVVRIILEDGTKEFLVTNLLDASITPDMLKELYFLRWGIESKYMELKSRLELESFTGACPISVEQEFFITMLLSNLSSILKADADDEIRRQTFEKNNRYQYQSNRSYILGRIKKLICPMLCGERDISREICRIYKEAVKRRSQIQPDRKCKRPRVQLQRKHFNNRKTCM